jgi:hypothetical protein
MLAILQQISLMKKEEHIFACSLLEAVAQMELTANTIIKFLQFKIVNLLTRLKTFLVGQDSVLTEKI